MISRVLQSLGCVVGLIVFCVLTVLTLYIGYVIAIGLFLGLLGYTFYKVITAIKTTPS